jgi:hypothetical protein
MIIYTSLFVFVVVKDKNFELMDMIPVKQCLIAAVTITTSFMGIQMANNGVKGHNWEQKMFDSENNTEGKK